VSKKRMLIVGTILMLLVGSLIVMGIYKKNGDAELESSRPTVRYAAPLTIAAAPVYVADAMGFWNDEGLDMKVTYFDSGRKALDALLSNNAEVMSVSETPPLRAYLAGSKINMITTVAEHKEAKMTVRTDRITNLQDVKGKKIGTVAGTNSDYYMYRWLEANNIKVSDVTIIQLDAAALSQSFIQGNIDAMFAWEPYNYNAASKIPNDSESWPTELYSGRHTVEMNSEYSKSHADVVEKIIRGFIKAEKYIKNNPDEAKKIVMNKTSMSKEALNKLWDEYTYTVQLDDGLKDILNNETSWIKSSGDSSVKGDMSDLVNPTFLLNVDPARVGGVFKS